MRANFVCTRCNTVRIGKAEWPRENEGSAYRQRASRSNAARGARTALALSAGYERENAPQYADPGASYPPDVRFTPESGHRPTATVTGQHVTGFSKRFLVIDRVVCVRSLQKYFFSFYEGGGCEKMFRRFRL